VGKSGSTSSSKIMALIIFENYKLRDVFNSSNSGREKILIVTFVPEALLFSS